MSIGIIVPTIEEAEGVEAREGVEMLISGMGKANAAIAATSLAERDCKHLVLWGSAGGLRAQVGDIVVVTRATYHDNLTVGNSIFSPQQQVWYLSNTPLRDSQVMAALDEKVGQSVQFGSMLTGDAFVTESSQLHFCGEALGVDMETAAVLQVASQRGIRATVVRVISDMIGNTDFPKWQQFVVNDMPAITRRVMPAVLDLL